MAIRVENDFLADSGLSTMSHTKLTQLHADDTSTQRPIIGAGLLRELLDSLDHRSYNFLGDRAF